VKVLGVSSAKRSAIAPDVPTVAEAAGIKDFDFTLWQGVFAPRGTPPGVIAKLNGEINKVLNDPETKKKLLEAGAEVAALSVEQFRSFVARESVKYQSIIKQTGITAAPSNWRYTSALRGRLARAAHTGRILFYRASRRCARISRAMQFTIAHGSSPHSAHGI
jgi:hypothetical protein